MSTLMVCRDSEAGKHRGRPERRSSTRVKYVRSADQDRGSRREESPFYLRDL